MGPREENHRGPDLPIRTGDRSLAAERVFCGGRSEEDEPQGTRARASGLGRGGAPRGFRQFGISYGAGARVGVSETPSGRAPRKTLPRAGAP
jgi:hypothetical protein